VTDPTRRLFAAAAPDLAGHAATNGPLPWLGGPGRLIPVAEAAGLTGRGGAGFPTWRKLRAVAQGGSRRVVVANAAESEPASAKDRVLLTRAPHLVLDGLQLAAESVDADRTYLYTGAGAFDAARRALAERAGTDRVPTRLVAAPDTFIAGEESAVVAAIDGRAALPRDKARRVIETGVRGRPTLVQNVETLAHLALLARYGPEWFRAVGTTEEPGTFLATVSGAVARPGVYENAYGVPLDRLLDAAGGATEPVRAVLVGGYHGAWVPAEATGVAMSRSGLAALGAAPGAGVVVVLPDSRCGLVESARIVSYLAREGAGQCGPCRNGLPRLAETMTELASGRSGPGFADAVHRLSALVSGRGACNHPDGTARFARSSLAAFAAEARRHLAGRCDAAGVAGVGHRGVGS
jgi:NADH:ubiquinone oxidoreductase subunit F (NADH-binding)